MKENNNIVKKSLISSLIFIILVILIFYLISREINFSKIFIIFKNANKSYLLIAILCMACFSLCEALNIKIALASFKKKISFQRAYKYALTGFFVASVTPSSSGGDPMQLYLMSRDKINVSYGAITLLLKLLAFQFVSIFLALIGFFSSFKLYTDFLGKMRYIVYLGILLNTLVFLIYFLIIFCKPIIIFLVELFSKILAAFKYKKVNSFKEKMQENIEEYSKAAKTLRKNKIIFLKIVFITLIQMMLYFSIPYYVYLALGFNDYSILTFISIQSVLFISVSFLPFPGSVGINEATFMRLYKSMFSKHVLGSAMVITRFINFYIFVFYSGIITLAYLLKSNIKKVK